MKRLLLILFLFASILVNAQGLKLSNFPSDGYIGTAAATYETYPLIHIKQTTPNVILWVPNPTDVTRPKNITITNNGTVGFTLQPGGFVLPMTGRILRWDGVNWIITGGGGATAFMQSGNTFLASPANGSNNFPEYRKITLADLPTLPSVPTAVSQLTNDANYISTAGETDPQFNAKLATKTTDNIAEGINNFFFTIARARGALNAGTGISLVSGLISNTAPDQVVTLTGAGLAKVTGTYPNYTITVDAPVISYPARTVNTNFTISTTRKALVFYTLTCSVTNPLLAGTSSATAFLEYSLNAGSTWQPVTDTGNSNGVGLAVSVALTNGQIGVLSGAIEINALVRVRTTTAGTATITLTRAQELQI